METVILDDEPLSKSQTDNDIIDLDKESSDDVIEIVEIPDDGYERSFPDISKKDAAFGELIEKCIALDDSLGMLRVINRTMVPLYRDGERKFRSTYDAELFNRTLIKTLENLENDPKHRYSHIKHICDVLKKIRSKRKVPLVTISREVKDTWTKRKHSIKKHSKPKIVGNVIHLDDDESEGSIVNSEVPCAISDDDCEVSISNSELPCAISDDECEVPIVKNGEPCAIAVDNREKENTVSDYIAPIVNSKMPCAIASNNSENTMADSNIAENKSNNTTENHYIEIDFSNVVFDSEMFNDHLPHKHDSVGAVSSSTPNISENTAVETRTLVTDSDKEISANVVTSSSNNMLSANIVTSNSNNMLSANVVTSNSNNMLSANVVTSNSNNMLSANVVTSNSNNMLSANVVTSNSNNMQSANFVTSNSNNMLSANFVTSSSNNMLNTNVVTSSTNNMPIKEGSSISAQENYVYYRDLTLEEKISNIEQKIATFKQLIDHYSTQEVVNDSDSSPYLECDRYQTQLVKLYEELCNLTGCPTVKHRKVRLHAIDSRPELPMKKIEELINNNIGPNGLPHFPDFEDVVECVREANFEAQLGWDYKRIEFEARGLYVHCGRALQRTRQKREWRDLMSLVKDESLEDPADKDQELQTRLTMNRLIANLKEQDVLERYNKLETNTLRRARIARVRKPKSLARRPTTVEMAIQHYYGTNLSDVNNTEEQEALRNENEDNSQIKIINVYSCKRVVSKENLILGENNINRVESVQCDSTKPQDVQNKSDSTHFNSNQIANFKDFHCNELHDNSAMDIENNNSDELNENFLKLSGEKSSRIELISIENMDDNEIHNITENVCYQNENILQNVSSKQTDDSLLQKIKIEKNDDCQRDNQNLELMDVKVERQNIQENAHNTKESDKATNLNEESAKKYDKDNLKVLDTLHFRIKFEQNDDNLSTSNHNSERLMDASMDNSAVENKENTEDIVNPEKVREPPSLQLPIKGEENVNLLNDNESVNFQKENLDNFETDHNNLTIDISLVKSESEAIRELEELGDNFIMTNLDIIDPFLIFEISDSSDDEDISV